MGVQGFKASEGRALLTKGTEGVEAWSCEEGLGVQGMMKSSMRLECRVHLNGGEARLERKALVTL